jgi:hypothetical protein
MAGDEGEEEIAVIAGIATESQRNLACGVHVPINRPVEQTPGDLFFRFRRFRAIAAIPRDPP